MKSTSLDEPIHVPNLTANTLSFVVEYLDHFASSASGPTEIEKPIRSTNFAELVSQWECQIVDLPHEELFGLVLAANYLGIAGLTELTSAKVASMIKGKTPEEIRRTFNIVSDFTAEEEAQIREENRWAEEA